MAWSLSRSFCALALLLLSTSSLLVSATSTTGPNQCVTFDSYWNLLAFNFNGKDYNAGALPSTAVKDITQAASRPPFDITTSSPLCFLSQFTNAIYVLNADATDRSSVYIFDATAGTWSKQPTTGAPTSYDPSVFAAILDHDTNVFYALSAGTMFSLDLSSLKAGTATAIPWNEVQRPDLAGTGSGDGGSGVVTYEPVMALAQNHIHFLGVPSLPVGDAKIFVIHFSFLQPDAQNYGSFPTEHGKTASFFKDAGVQTQFAYIPDDGSATYIVDVTTNTTRSYPAPSLKDQYAQYTASTTALVQLASEGGGVQYLAYDPNSSSASTVSWQTISAIPAATNTPATSGSSSSGNGTVSTMAAGTGNAGTGTKNGTATSGNATVNTSSSSGAESGVRVRGVWGMCVAGVLLGLGGIGLGL